MSTSISPLAPTHVPELPAIAGVKVPGGNILLVLAGLAERIGTGQLVACDLYPEKLTALTEEATESEPRQALERLASASGDFRGLAQKLDYLQEVGVNAVWLMPFFPSPLRDDGYDISDYTSVHSNYGTLDDFKRFLTSAHERCDRFNKASARAKHHQGNCSPASTSSSGAVSSSRSKKLWS